MDFLTFSTAHVVPMIVNLCVALVALAVAVGFLWKEEDISRVGKVALSLFGGPIVGAFSFFFGMIFLFPITGFTRIDFNFNPQLDTRASEVALMEEAQEVYGLSLSREDASTLMQGVRASSVNSEQVSLFGNVTTLDAQGRVATVTLVWSDGWVLYTNGEQMPTITEGWS